MVRIFAHSKPFLACIAVSAVLVLAGCGGENAVGSNWDPMPPQTVISSSAVEVNPAGGYWASLHWFGYTPETDIDHFDIRVSADSLASAWVSVVVTDSVFAIGSEVEALWEFTVKAVDERGCADPTPAAFTYAIPR